MIKEYEADRYYYSFPGGESAYDMEENRVKGFVKDLNKLDNENIIIVSHGITIKTITKVIMNYDVRWFDYEYNCKNASVRHLILSKQGNIDNGYIHGGTSHPNKTLVRK
jgi:broad specificity phosphatase PhoE